MTAPTIKIGNSENVQEVKAGTEAKATLSSKVEGADALAASWKIVRRVGAKIEAEETLASPEYLGKEAAVKYTFALPGEYEIVEAVTTDNLAIATKQVVRKVKAVLPAITFKIEPTSSLPPEGLSVGTEIKLQAKLADSSEAEPHLQLTWRFGDGTTVGPQAVVGKEGKYTAVVEHAFTSTCGGVCTVTLEAKDQAGAEGHGELKLFMYTPPSPPIQEPPPTTTTPGNGGVLPKQTVHNPEAKIAGSTSLSVSARGAVTLNVSCPAKESECVGTVTLQTIVARAPRGRQAEEGDRDPGARQLRGRGRRQQGADPASLGTGPRVARARPYRAWRGCRGCTRFRQCAATDHFQRDIAAREGRQKALRTCLETGSKT